ncbi:hypothetical protein EJB05_27832, partial [Eragrostis curvula]
MASRRFFGYDPYDYYYTTSPYQYPYPYYHRHQQPATAGSVGGFFPGAEPAAVRRPRHAANAAPVSPAPRAKTVSIPVHFVGSDPVPEPAAPVVAKKRAPSAEEAAVRVQAAARGLLARRAVRALRAVEREAEEVGKKVAREAEALRGDARARIGVGEELMRLLLRLDAVRGAREYRRRVAKRVLALQDAVDALEPRQEPAAVAEDVELESEVIDAAADEMAEEESDVAPGLPDGVEHSGGETEAMAPAVADAEMEVDGDRAASEPCAAEENETERVPDGANRVDDMSDNAEADGVWEMVTEEPEPAAEAVAPAEQPRQEPAGELRKSEAAGGGVDAKKVMEMVAALCERSAQQCAVIGALAERVDALERAVRQVEDAERRRRRAKKLRKEGKGSNRNKCCVD